MKPLSLIIFVALAQSAFAQIKVTQIDKKDIPASIHYVGHIINAARYTDNKGEHIIITTETRNVVEKDGGDTFKKAELYAYSYKIDNNKPSLSWQMHDFVNDCGFDVYVHFIPNSFAITDINKDGIAEAWLMYITTCTSDVSPATMKIIMHEGEKKYAMRGRNKVDEGNKHYVGGEYAFDRAFNESLPAFKQYAIQLWNKNIMMSWKW